MDIDKDEVLRYLGINPKKADNKMLAYINDCIEENLQESNPKYIYKIFDLSFQRESILIEGTNLYLKGRDIKAHLEHSLKCVLFAATLGSSIERRIGHYKSYDLTRILVLDACATALIESVCSEIEEEIKGIGQREYGLNITSRYSPGYGDLSLNIQPKLLDVLEAHRIGLTVTEDLIMIPRKSVTAIIGLQKEKGSFTGTCRKCTNRGNCPYRKEL